MASAATGRQVMRRLVSYAVLSLIGLLVCQTLLLDGLLPAFRVDSGSMAPSILGPHARLACESCRFEFAAEPPRSMSAIRLRCPNCGRVLGSSGRIAAGDRLLVNRAAFAFRSPKRYDVVVLDCIESAQPCVKRVIGLPGETVELRRGNVWIDGKIHRKSLPEWRDMRILVHDDRFRPASGRAALAWKPQNRVTASSTFDGHWLHRSSPQKSTSAPGLIVFTEAGDLESSPFLWDDLPYNSNESRQLNRATDVSLACRLTLDGKGTFTLRGNSGSAHVVAEYELATGMVRLKIDDQTVAKKQVGGRAHPREWELVLIDSQVIVVADGAAVCSTELRVTAAKRIPPTELAIGITGHATCTIEQLQVFRDIYYTDVPEMPGPRQLSENEYFVLGDNSSASRDSRHWPAGAVQRQHIHGKPVMMK